MANKLFIHRINRLTLVRKGRGLAKHPDMRDGVLEVVKSTPESPESPAMRRWRTSWQ